jgi:hypothetical protein
LRAVVGDHDHVAPGQIWAGRRDLHDPRRGRSLSRLFEVYVHRQYDYLVASDGKRSARR